MSKTTQIKIEITRNVTPMISTENGGEWAMGFHDIEMDFDDGNLIGLMNEKGLTGMGYKCLVQSLASCITHAARNASKQGFSEGEIIKDAISILESQIIDPNIKEAESSILRR